MSPLYVEKIIEMKSAKIAKMTVKKITFNVFEMIFNY